MLGWICRIFGHRWDYGNWQLFMLGGVSLVARRSLTALCDRPPISMESVWRRDIVCNRCGEERWETCTGPFKPLDLA